MDLQEVEGGVWNILNWFKIGTVVGLFSKL